MRPVKYSFGSYKQPFHYDWQSFDEEGIGVDAPAFLLTGVLSGGDYQRQKQMVYLTMHFDRTETYGGTPAEDGSLAHPYTILNNGSTYTKPLGSIPEDNYVWFKYVVPEDYTFFNAGADPGTTGDIDMFVFSEYPEIPDFQNYQWFSTQGGLVSEGFHIQSIYLPPTSSTIYIACFGYEASDNWIFNSTTVS